MDRNDDWTWDRYTARFEVAEQLHATYDCYSFKYEDFTDKRLDGISAYLGLDVAPVRSKNVDVLHGHVVRSATYGDWRNWFVASDIDFFRPMFKTYMDTFGYEDEWTLADAPVIPPETASGYVLDRRPVVEARFARRFDRPPAPAVVDPASAEALRELADSTGSALHAFRYATVMLEGRVAPADTAGAFRYAYRSALLGHLPAMDLVAQMFRDGTGCTPDDTRAALWAREALRVRRNAALRAPVPVHRRLARNFMRVVGRKRRTARRTAAS
jgi:hypothetical protein